MRLVDAMDTVAMLLQEREIVLEEVLQMRRVVHTPSRASQAVQAVIEATRTILEFDAAVKRRCCITCMHDKR